ncbi:hypothetical protein LguiB_036377 [Lonicera macranthoides]
MKRDKVDIAVVSLVTSIGSVSENGVAKRGRKVKEASDHIHHAIMTVIRRYDNLMNQVGVYMPMNASSNSRLMRYVYAEIQSHHIDSVSENGVANRRRKVKEAVTNHFLIAHDHNLGLVTSDRFNFRKWGSKRGEKSERGSEESTSFDVLLQTPHVAECESKNYF